MANWWDSLPDATPLDEAMAHEGVSGQLADLARSVYQQESGSGRNTRTSNAGAVGGMQILPGTFSEVADEGWDINDPVTNARAGVRYLGRMLEAGGGDPRLAAIGYYGGPGAIRAAQQGQARRDPRNPNAPDTFGYADQVLARILPAAHAGSAPAQAPAETGNWWDQYETVEPPAAYTEYTDGLGDAVRVPIEGTPQRSFAERAGDAIMDIPRQVGLTGRYALEGLGQAASTLTEPIRQGLNVGLRAAGLPEAAPTAAVMSSAADALGMPQPQNPNERVVGDVARLMAGGGGIMSGAGALARGATGATQSVLQALAANPGSQLASAAGTGAAGGSVREAGGSPLAQAGASLLGGFAGPMALSGVQSAGRSIANRAQSYLPQQVDQQIQRALAQSGVDMRALPVRVQQQLREEAGQALRTGGDLDPAAMARLADFARIEGATPTRGMLSQDPGQVTREMNLAKLQANTSGSGVRNLSQIQADNNSALVRALNSMGADSADDAVASGQRAIEALQQRLSGRQARINDLYSLARDSAGRSFPLDGRAFADRAIQALDDQLVGGALPADVRNHLNRISAGEVPFTVDYAEQLKTLMGRLQRGASDGSARYALGLVRQALDDAPVLPLGQQTAAAGARAVNPGNLPATAGTEIGEQAISAFNQARSANRSLMRQIERTPALKALYEGNISPDNFVSKYVTSSSARTADVQRLGRMLAAHPPARDAVRTSITQQLKDKALSGLPDDAGPGVARFSAAQYAKALKQIGDRKLGAFFDADEIAQLHAIGRVGRLMTNQPVGSAVNNSNTAASTIGRVLDMMGRAGRGAKLLGIGDQMTAIQSGMQQRAARQITPALSLPPPMQPAGNRLIPASVYGSLLAAPGVPGPEQDHRP